MNSAKRERLYNGITEISEQHITEAPQTRLRTKSPSWRRWAAVAAGFTVVIGSVYGAARMGLFDRLGGAASGSTGSGGTSGPTTFMSYTGPVLPLTTLETGTGLTAERDITLDFSPWVPVWISNEDKAASRTDLSEEERQQVLKNYQEWFPKGGYWQSSGDILVTDSYTLSNTSPADQTVTLIYPYARNLDSEAPELTLNGTAVEAEDYAGSYSGGYTGAIGSEESGQHWNIDNLSSWEDYAALLEDGSYLREALAPILYWICR